MPFQLKINVKIHLFVHGIDSIDGVFNQVALQHGRPYGGVAWLKCPRFPMGTCKDVEVRYGAFSEDTVVHSAGMG